MKPLTYLTALQKGLQPNTLVPDDPITLPPIGNARRPRHHQPRGRRRLCATKDYWTPRNADYRSGGVYTIRRGLENSVNVVTAHLLDGGIDRDPEQSLDEVCATAVAAKIYTDCMRYYPFVLGAQPVRMIDLAAFYAAVANEGARPQPHGIDSIESGGRTVFQYPNDAAALDRRCRPHLVLSAQDHAAGRGGARHRARHRRAFALCRRQDRHDRGRGRRLVRRLHQRRDRRGLGRLRQRRRQTPLARRQRDRRAGGAADLRADHPGDLVRRHCAEGAAQRALRPRRSVTWSTCRSIIASGAAGQRAGASSSISGVGDDGRFNETQYQIVSPRLGSRSCAAAVGGPAPKAIGPVRRGDDGRAPGRNYYPAQGWQLQPVQPQQPSFFNQIFPRGLFTPRSQSDDPRNAVREQPEYLSNGRFN